nr:uncharacterized protein LOC125966899 isoform X1 [Syngnathus scovelli]
MDGQKEQSLKSRSYKSRSTKAFGNAAAMARAEAEAAKVLLSFTDKEMILKMEKAQLEARMEMEKAQLVARMEKLSLEKNVAAAEAKAEALEAAASINGSERGSRKIQLNENPFNPLERTREYVTQQSKEHSTVAREEYAPTETDPLNILSNLPPHLLTQNDTNQLYTKPPVPPRVLSQDEPVQLRIQLTLASQPFSQDEPGQRFTEPTMAPHLHSHDEARWLHVESTSAPYLPPQGDNSYLHANTMIGNSITAPRPISENGPADVNLTYSPANRLPAHCPQQHAPITYLIPRDTQGHQGTYTATPRSRGPSRSTVPNYTPQRNQHNQSGINDVVRYFARRKLVTTSMTQFNNKPASYRAWRLSFQNAVRGLNLTPSEEMDLLVKWLRKESGEHAKRIRDVNANHPKRGLQMTWDRLDACDGAPEVVEEALFQRVNNFPKITNKDCAKLHELSDLLMELRAAKADGTLPGLQYLDTARGISPLVQRLPFSLQEKWRTNGSSYKQCYGVSFPPSEFSWTSSSIRLKS